VTQYAKDTLSIVCYLTAARSVRSFEQSGRSFSRNDFSAGDCRSSHLTGGNFLVFEGGLNPDNSALPAHKRVPNYYVASIATIIISSD
jgi:hypothetical protein